MSSTYSTSTPLRTPSFTTSALENPAKSKNPHPCRERTPRLRGGRARPSDQLSVNSEFCSVARQMCRGAALVAVFVQRCRCCKPGPVERSSFTKRADD